jgi:hypothetical protein
MRVDGRKTSKKKKKTDGANQFKFRHSSMALLVTHPDLPDLS